jgi:hypothetical protein
VDALRWITFVGVLLSSGTNAPTLLMSTMTALMSTARANYWGALDIRRWAARARFITSRPIRLPRTR